MNRRIPSFVAAAAAAAALCAVSACSASSPQTSAAPKLVSIDASWAEYYHSMSALKAHSDVAVEGTITKASVEPRASSTDVPYTDFQFTVGSTLLDPRHKIAAATAAKPAVLTIHQTGGTVDDTTFQVDDDPLFKVGQKYVLFLQEYSPGHYKVAGGPTGRFTVAASGAIAPIVSDGVKFSGGLPALNQAIKTS